MYRDGTIPTTFAAFACLPLPGSACLYLLLPLSSCLCLSLPASAFLYLPQPFSTCLCLSLPVKFNFDHRQTDPPTHRKTDKHTYICTSRAASLQLKKTYIYLHFKMNVFAAYKTRQMTGLVFAGRRMVTSEAGVMTMTS